MQPRSFYDISPLISARTAVFPGDQPFERRVALDFARGDPYALSSFRTTPHIGAHADAPSHYHPEGKAIHERDLRLYMGSCQVVGVSLPPGARIQPRDLPAGPLQGERVLFKTRSFGDPDRWTDDFNSLSPELVDALADRGAVLVGIDTPSVDPACSKGLESHRAIYRRNLAVLEGVVLDEVPDGLYTLIALPLRIEGADASPVRAVLVRDWAAAGAGAGSE